MSQELWYHLPLTVAYPGSRYDTIPLKRDLDFDILKLSKVASRRNDAIDKSFLSSTAGIIDVPNIYRLAYAGWKRLRGFFRARRISSDKKTGPSSGRVSRAIAKKEKEK